MKQLGFTLVELIVVIAIIAILSAVIAPNAYRAVEKAKITRVMADLKSIQTAALAYYSDTSLWPPDVCPDEDPGFMNRAAYLNSCCPSTAWGAPWTYPLAQQAASINASWNGPYLEKRIPATPWGGSYDWEYWPFGAWLQPAGTYVSVRPFYGTTQKGGTCGCPPSSLDATSVPDRFQIKLQQEGIDLYYPNGINSADDQVITQIMRF